MRILQTMISLRVTLTPMVILLLMISLSSCNGKPKISRAPAFSVETKEKAIAACSLMKQKEHNWKAKDIKAYCKEFWRGYITFIKES